MTDAASLEAQFANVKLQPGQGICSDHGVQWFYDAETSKPDVRGMCGQCIIETRSGQFVACKDHGIQPAAPGTGLCRVCTVIGVSVEAGPPPLPPQGSVPSLGVPNDRVDGEQGSDAGAVAAASDGGDRGDGGRGEGSEGSVLPPPLPGDGSAGAGTKAAPSPATNPPTPQRPPAQGGKRPLYQSTVE